MDWNSEDSIDDFSLETKTKKERFEVDLYRKLKKRNLVQPPVCECCE